MRGKSAHPKVLIRCPANPTASLLTDPTTTFDSLVQASSLSLPSDILAVYIQAVSKIYASLTSSDSIAWTPERKAYVTLLTERIVRFLEPLTISPSLEVQERAVEFLELFRVALEAITAQPAAHDDSEQQYEPPLLLTQAIPSLFSGQELNPVAPRAQRKVPSPPGLDLDEPINPNLRDLLVAADYNDSLAGEEDQEDEEFHKYYYTKPTVAPAMKQPATLGIDSAAAKSSIGSYQNVSQEDYLDADILARRRRERLERNRDDPFYIFAPGETDGVTDADLESIPVLELKLDDLTHVPATQHHVVLEQKRERIQIIADEGIEGEDDLDVADEGPAMFKKKGKKKGGLLQVDASGLMGYSLDEEKENRKDEIEAQVAKREVERLRKEMELAAERVAVQRRSSEAGKVEKKKKKKPKTEEGEPKPKKTKKKAKSEGVVEGEAEGTGEKKKTKGKSKKGKEKQIAVEVVS
jgi:AP-3 complex subunit delta-1